MRRMVFGPFTFDAGELTLRRRGSVVPLTPKVCEALAILLENPGALVAKEILRARLWPEGFVEDGNLTQTIYVLRRALDPDGDGRAFIETVPRRGYRFVAAVSIPQERKRNPLRFGLAAALAFAVLAGSIFAVAQSRSGANQGLSADASRAYALGHYYWDKRTLDGTHRAIAYYEEVIRLAPHSPLGYAGLAETYAMVANHDMVGGDLRKYYAKAEFYARQALAQDSQSGEARAILGFIAYDRDSNSTLAERDLRIATSLQPSFAEGHEFLGVVLFDRGNIGEAHRELARAAALDPLSPPILRWLGVSSYYMHDFQSAKRALRQALDLDRNEDTAAWFLVRTQEQLGETKAAAELLAQQRLRIAAMKKKDPYTIQELRALRALIALREGNRELASRFMPNLTPTPKPSEKFDVTLLAALNLQLGRREDAVRWLRLGLDYKPKSNLRELISRDPDLHGVCDAAKGSGIC